MGEVLGHGFFGQVYKVGMGVWVDGWIGVSGWMGVGVDVGVGGCCLSKCVYCRPLCTMHALLSSPPAGASQGNRKGDGDEEDGTVH